MFGVRNLAKVSILLKFACFQIHMVFKLMIGI